MHKIPRNDAFHDFPNFDSDKRKKLDGYTIFGNGDAEDIRDKYDQKSLKPKPKYDLRKSFAWDSAFTTNSGFLEIDELLTISNSWQSQNGICDILGNEDQDQLLPVKYPEPELPIATDEFNLRKSLAWDSAFFTSEGILNPEELSLVNKGFKKSEFSMLATIDEPRISFESNCATENDGSSLAELREASCTRASSSRKQRYINMQKEHSTKRVDGEGVLKLKVKSRPTSRSPAMNGNQPERIVKESSTSQFRKFSGGRSDSDPTSPPKPPKMLGGRVRNIPAAPTKRVPLFSSEVNGERKIVKATNGKNLIPKPELSKACLEFSSLSLQSSKNSKARNGTCRKFCNEDNDASAQSGLELHPHEQSNVSHSDMENMCPNIWREVKGSNSVSFDASRNTKPSGLRIPSPTIGFFDALGDSQLAKENGGGNSHSGT